ncbi:MAG: SH3 domain-containing protein [Treponema sp.]|nr:SH3 domain-containing protein [Treponema sp.]
MKRMIIFVCATIFLTSNIIAETHDVSNTMYVIASPSLRVRNSPGIDAEVIGRLPFLTEVNVIREGDYDFVDSIAKWVYIDKPIEGWIFSSYLTAVNIGENIKLREGNNDREQFFGTWVYSRTSRGETWVDTLTISESHIIDGQESFIGGDTQADYSEYYGLTIIGWTPIHNTDKATMEQFPNGYLVIYTWDSIAKFKTIFLSKDGKSLFLGRIDDDGKPVEYIRQQL